MLEAKRKRIRTGWPDTRTLAYIRRHSRYPGTDEEDKQRQPMKSSLRRLGRILSWLQTGWSILGVTLVMVVLLELGLRGVFVLKDRWKPQIPPDPRVVSEDRDGGAWLPLHYRELEALSDRWQPYVYFRQRPFPGQTVTVLADGSRATWQPPPRQGDDARARPLKILMLGGSSLWGFGARDDQTIPSLIARGLHERGVHAEIRNLAEIGYVSTQEVIALTASSSKDTAPISFSFTTASTTRPRPCWKDNQR